MQEEAIAIYQRLAAKVESGQYSLETVMANINMHPENERGPVIQATRDTFAATAVQLTKMMAPNPECAAIRARLIVLVFEILLALDALAE